MLVKLQADSASMAQADGASMRLSTFQLTRQLLTPCEPGISSDLAPADCFLFLKNGILCQGHPPYDLTCYRRSLHVYMKEPSKILLQRVLVVEKPLS